MKRFLICLFVIITVSLSFPLWGQALVSESGICSDVPKYNMQQNNALTIGNITASKKVIAFIDPT
ncbi:MAG TPA: hypothetical protein VEF33_04920 [Syntrophales bacterium]|nr:hypothetical protein [Syntrophales bacterium]